MFKRFFTEVDPMWYMSLVLLYFVTFALTGPTILIVCLFTTLLFCVIVFPVIWAYKIATEK